MSDLKPCKCGNAVKSELIFDLDGNVCVGHRYYCKCDVCQLWCRANTEEELVTLWNTRPVEDALRAEVEAVWQATGVAGSVRGLTTLEDVVAIHRKELVEARSENKELWIENQRLIGELDKAETDLKAAKRRIAELEAENAALTAERDHARQDAAATRLKLAEYQRPFTVMVEIPEQYNDGECSLNCPVSKQRFMASGHWECNLGFMVNGCPGPGCPRYQKPEV